MQEENRKWDKQIWGDKTPADSPYDLATALIAREDVQRRDYMWFITACTSHYGMHNADYKRAWQDWWSCHA